MTLRWHAWTLDLIVALSLLGTAISGWLTVAAHRTRKESRSRLTTRAEQELLDIPVSGAFFRLAQQVAFLGFAVVLWTALRPGVYPLLVLYLVGQGIIPLHSFLLLRKAREAANKIPRAPPPPREEP